MTRMKTSACNLDLTWTRGESLPASVGDGFISSYWKPNAEELAMLAAGFPIKLSILGERHPPVAVEVEAL
jgi:hypothetical protein